MAELSVSDFLGGMTDEYLTAAPNQYQRADNLLLNSMGNLLSRPGSVIFDISNAQLPTGAKRVGTLVNFQDDTALIAQSGTHVYSYSAGWNEILGPNSNAVFSTGSESSHVSTAQWGDHLYMTNDSSADVAKIYRDAGGNYKVLTAGLPAYPTGHSTSTEKAAILALAITLANAIRTKLIAHLANATNHATTSVYNPTAASNESTLVALTMSMMDTYKAHINDTRMVLSPPVVHFTSTPGKRIQLSCGNFFLREYACPVDLLGLLGQSCIPILNDLKRVLNYHIDAFPMEPNIAIDSRVHPGASVGLVTASSVDVSPAPIFTGKTGKAQGYTYEGNAYIYAYLNMFISMFNSHANDVTGLGGAGKGGHVTTNPGYLLDTIAPCTDEYTFVMCVYKLIVGYMAHRSSLLHSSGFDAAGTLTDANYENYVSSSFLTYKQPLRVFDPDVASEISSIFTLLFSTFLSDFAAHITVGGTRHQAAGAVPADYYLETTVPTTPPTLANILYSFTYKNVYTTSDGITFENISSVHQLTTKPIITSLPITFNDFSFSKGPVGTFEVSISGLVPLATTKNWPTDTGKIQIYRKSATGTVFHLIAELANTQSTYEDTSSDTFLLSQPSLYSTGGVLENDPVPKARFLHVLGEKLYYGYIFDDTDTYPNRILESIGGSLDSTPAGNYLDLPFEQSGITSVKGTLIAFTKTSTYRIEGTFDSLGGGAMSYICISDQVGCIAPYGIVQTDGACIFLGESGVYVTDGYTVTKISSGWNTTYRTIVGTYPLNITGTLNHADSTIWWTITRAGTECDSFLILDTKPGIKGNSCFTTASNKNAATDYFSPTAVTYYNKQLIRGDSLGYVYKHDHSYTTDPKTNSATAASTWAKKTIFFDYRSPSFDFGTPTSRKWVNHIFMHLKNLGNASVQVTSIDDDGRKIHTLTPTRFRNDRTVGGTDATLTKNGGPGFGSNRSMIETKRRMPNGSVKCTRKQVQITNGNVVMYKSDDLGLATVGATTVVLAAGSWASDLEDQFILFAKENYLIAHPIVSTSTSTLTFTTTVAVANRGSQGWMVMGYPKDERIQLVDYALTYILKGEEQKDAGGETGENK